MPRATGECPRSAVHVAILRAQRAHQAAYPIAFVRDPEIGPTAEYRRSPFSEEDSTIARLQTLAQFPRDLFGLRRTSG